MPLAEITTALTSLKATLDFVKGAKAAIDKVEIANQLTDVYGKLIAAQSQTLTLQLEHSTLITEKDNIAKKLVQFENWAKTEQEHELHQPNPGIFVYVRKDTDDKTKKFPWLCANCFEGKIKSILQCKHDWEKHASYACPRCKTMIEWSYPGAYEKEEPPDPIW